jgi:hypothetical protein
MAGEKAPGDVIIIINYFLLELKPPTPDLMEWREEAS